MAQTSYGTITITDTTDIAEIENWYLASNKGSGVTISESGWTKDVTNVNAVMTADKQYLWNYEKILGTGDVVINTTSPVIIGRYGQNGGTGAAGRGISSIDEYYQVTNSTSNPGSSGWQKNTLVTPTASKPYLWNYQVINYVNPTSTQGSYADARIIGVYGDKGDTGISVSSTIKYYQLATSKPSQPSNNATIPSGWETSEPTFDSSKLTYTLYTVIQTTYSNGNIVYSTVQVDSAFEAAKVAYQKAQIAQTNAGDALISANGKNTIYYQAQKPTGGTYKAGDTWFDTNDGNAIYTWDEDLSDWVPAQLGENAIANLAITNAKIANLDGAKIVANSIDANSLNADSINTSNKITIGAFDTTFQEDILNSVISDDMNSRFEQIDTSLGQVNDLIDEHSSAIQTLNGQMETIMAPIELDASSDNPFIKIQAINKDSPTSQEFAYLLLTKDRISFFKVTDADNDLSTQEDQIKNEVLYIDSTESQGVIDINNARVHQSIRIGQLEIFQYNGGIAVRRTR